jgi:ribosomal protein S18 acetylase RimI-like enzyme
VRLDVINTNPKAKKLYENIGYKSIKMVSFPYLEKLLGFSGVTTMILNIDKTISNLK